MSGTQPTFEQKVRTLVNGVRDWGESEAKGYTFGDDLFMGIEPQLVVTSLVKNHEAECRTRADEAVRAALINEAAANLRMCEPNRGIHSNEWLTEYFNGRIAQLSKGTEGKQ